MSAQLQQWRDKFDALSLRERVLLAGAVLVVVFIVWLEFIHDPQSSRRAALHTQVETLRSQLEASQVQLGVLSTAQAQDPDQANRQRLQQLQDRLAQLDGQLRERLAGLISPAQMTEVLEAVLTRQTDLKLVAARNLPIRPLLEPVAEADGAAAQGGVYQHGLQLEFSGSYLGTLEYLKALQQLPWGFYWDELSLEVEQYPRARITIVVHTLSLREGWIGV